MKALYNMHFLYILDSIVYTWYLLFEMDFFFVSLMFTLYQSSIAQLVQSAPKQTVPKKGILATVTNCWNRYVHECGIISCTILISICRINHFESLPSLLLLQCIYGIRSMYTGSRASLRIYVV